VITRTQKVNAFVAAKLRGAYTNSALKGICSRGTMKRWMGKRRWNWILEVSWRKRTGVEVVA